ncbi:hypothetical protein ebA2909 [Aromatoleum aromaticum EbN1]|uniref:Uncharacterized protein n=1 Tax=Aromatoleum aromaticum (strain DSM 19018 / LMG 30748 / EbN1) TaxID=76114 RepID=Q5P4K0_AROAE|nr:hypothetical protein ebA2909 [Aromatoleum aromaticum EbN1]
MKPACGSSGYARTTPRGVRRNVPGRRPSRSCRLHDKYLSMSSAP